MKTAIIPSQYDIPAGLPGRKDRPMIVGVVSDIHCNVEGLRAAVAAMGRIDHLICLGDCIYDFRFSNEVVAQLREYKADVIMGNHEEGFFGPNGVRARQAAWIDQDHFEWLGSRPRRLELDLHGRSILVVHSTPWEPRGDYIYPKHAKLPLFGEVDADFVLYGHTHMPVVRRFGRALVVNPGTAGDPRFGPMMSCAVLDLEANDARIIEYTLMPEAENSGA